MQIFKRTKTQNKRLTFAIITSLIILLLVNLLGYALRPTTTDNAFSQIETFHSLPENSVEVIGYGSSHMFSSFDPTELYEEYGIGSYNYGWLWQKSNTEKLFIKDSLVDQKPKVAVIEMLFVDDVIEDSDINPEIYYSRYLKNKKAVNEYLKECFGNKLERYITYLFPILAYHDNWKNFSLKNLKKIEIDPTFKQNFGYYNNSQITKVNIWDYQQFHQEELSEIAEKNLNEMLEICEKNDISVVLCTMPFAQEEYYYIDALKKYSKEHDCVYINFFELIDEIGINGDTDFADEGHLNSSGAKKVSNYLGKFLIENYDLTDMRKVPNNLWGN